MNNKTIFKLILICFTVSLLSNFTSVYTKAETNYNSPLCIGYFPYYGDISKVDVSKLTHIYFAFGYIYHNETLPPFTTDLNKTTNENLIGTLNVNQVSNALKTIPELKSSNPDLKAVLSLGGYAGRGFCDATSTKENREKLINSIDDTIKKYNLDGIDIDWECPYNGGWGTIQCCEEDPIHYTLFIKELREKIGNDKIISIAIGAGWEFRHQWIEFKALSEICDYITIMNYDYAYSGTKYNSSLYNSSQNTHGISTDDVIKDCINMGIPRDKLVMGAAFYGRIPTTNGMPDYADKNILSSLGFLQGDTAESYRNIISLLNNQNIVVNWDDEAKNPYLSYKHSSGEEMFILQYEDPISLGIKGRYVKDNNLRGIMIWETTQDLNGELLSSIHRGLYSDFNVNVNPDLNNDHNINIIDLSILSNYYNLPTSLDNNLKYFDFNCDNIIDIFDIVMISKSI